MKNLMPLFLVLFCASMFLVACENDSAVRENAASTIDVPENTDVTIPSTTTPAAAGSVQHYTCPNNCAGSGGGAAGTCPVCGTAYAHNQAFHNQTAPTTTTTPITPPTPTPSDASAAQNAAGVWHYTCGNGCAGGAGAAGNCATCGSPLAHNQAYHN